MRSHGGGDGTPRGDDRTETAVAHETMTGKGPREREREREREGQGERPEATKNSKQTFCCLRVVTSPLNGENSWTAGRGQIPLAPRRTGCRPEAGTRGHRKRAAARFPPQRRREKTLSGGHPRTSQRPHGPHCCERSRGSLCLPGVPWATQRQDRKRDQRGWAGRLRRQGAEILFYHRRRRPRGRGRQDRSRQRGGLGKAVR